MSNAGQSTKITPHCLRHTTGTRLAHAGVDTKTIMEFLGHKNVATTMRYVHATSQTLQDARRKITQHDAGPGRYPHERNAAK